MPVFGLVDDWDDELNDDDQIPDVRSGRPATGQAKAQVGRVDKAAGAAAFAQLNAARSSLDEMDGLIGRGDYSAARALLAEPPLATLEQSLLTLVAAPQLGPEEKIAIGTIKRYGVGADALIMLGGLDAAVKAKNGAGAADYTSKAKSALDEIKLACKTCFK